MGLNQDCFEIENIVDGYYHIKFVLKNKVDGFRWALFICVWSSTRGAQRTFFVRVSMSLH
jgi:hypothetical protein